MHITLTHRGSPDHELDAEMSDLIGTEQEQLLTCGSTQLS